MHIVMMSNTYKPFVGGVERSIDTFTEELQARGHRVLIVAPKFEGAAKSEGNIIRIPAIQQFNGTDFSVPLPVPGILSEVLDRFKPDIIHSHHPYLIGDTALRVGARRGVPVVFTFHTFYERYTHYVPGDSPAIKRFVVALATGYANLCERVVAPSPSVAKELKHRGIATPIEVVPTGIDVRMFSAGDGHRFRKRWGIPEKAFLVGTVSRLAPEKNIAFLTEALGRWLAQKPAGYVVVVGDGPSRAEAVQTFMQHGVAERIILSGTLGGEDLVDAYAALDTFAFASETETQGLVLAEALAAGVPVVAVDAPAVSDVTGRKHASLVEAGDPEGFVRALNQAALRSPAEKGEFAEYARERALQYEKGFTAECLLEVYQTASVKGRETQEQKGRHAWESAKRLIRAELEIIHNMAAATSEALETNSRRKKDAGASYGGGG
ncbi:MAG: glycosyltransferase [Chitinivibrionales bacterium]|nr:glycosyltransferase [Chitinivibrionales bacterium]MBD3357034.1 glycosyltransferase [Chitinivibrionales bacterium]